VTGTKRVTPVTKLSRAFCIMAGAQHPLQDFLSSLVNVKANVAQQKELQLARMKNKLRKGREKERKQKQRVREMVGNLEATREENDRLRSEILRIQTEMASLTDDTE